MVTADLRAAIVSWHDLLRAAAEDFLNLTEHSMSFSLTKTRYVDVLACENYALSLYKDQEPRTESNEMILGHLVDALVIERVTLESGLHKELGCFPLPRLPRSPGCEQDHDQAEGLSDAPSLLSETEELSEEELEAVLSHVEDLHMVLKGNLGELTPETRSSLASQLAKAASNIAKNFPFLSGAFMPRTQKSYRILLSGPNEPEITLSGRVDLLIGNPATDRASTCILDVKSGEMSEDHRKENYFYALLETLASGAPPFQVGTYYARNGSFELDIVDPTLLERTVVTVCKAIRSFGELLGSESPREPTRKGQFRCYWCKFNDSCTASLTSKRPERSPQTFSPDEDDSVGQPEDEARTEAFANDPGTPRTLEERDPSDNGFSGQSRHASKNLFAPTFYLPRAASLQACLKGAASIGEDAGKGPSPATSIQSQDMTQLRKECRQITNSILERLATHIESSLPAGQRGGTRFLTEWDFSLILADCKREAEKLLHPEPSCFAWSPWLAKRSLAWHCLAQLVNADAQDSGDKPTNAPRNLAESAVRLSKCAFPAGLFTNHEPATASSTGADFPGLTFPISTRQKVLEWLEQSASEAERIASAALAHTMAADLWHLVDLESLKASAAKLVLDGNPKDVYYSVTRTAPLRLRARWFLEITLPASNGPGHPSSYPRKVIVDSSTHPTTGSQFSNYELQGGFISLLHLLGKDYLPLRIVYLCPASGTSQVVEVDKSLLTRTLDVLEGFADEVDRQARL